MISYRNGWKISSCIGITLIATVISFTNAVLLQDIDDELDASPRSAQVEIRAVFIKCVQDSNDLKDSQEVDGISDVRRFEREELFRHDALRNCLKKLALTLRLSSAPGDANSEEYIPIEHVFDGPNRRRVRLLEPYVLRLRRAAPLQAYALQHVDRILAILTKKEKNNQNNKKVINDNDNKNSRQQRDLDHQMEDDEWPNRMEAAGLITLDHDPSHSSFSVKLKEPKESLFASNSTLSDLLKPNDCGLRLLAETKAPTSSNQPQTTTTTSQKRSNRAKRDPCINNFLDLQRSKRREHNIVFEDNVGDDKTPVWMLKDQADSLEPEPQQNHAPIKTGERSYEVQIGGHEKTLRKVSSFEDSLHSFEEKSSSNLDMNKNNHNHNEKRRSDSETEEEFVLYAIRDPELWHTVQIQLYKKFNDEDGKVVWDDVTKGMTADVGLTTPVWSGDDLSVRYKPLDWVGPGDFTLPKKTSLCLLIPHGDQRSSRDSDSKSHYIVVPVEDIIGGSDILKKRTANFSEKYSADKSEYEKPKRVVIHASRAWVRSSDDQLAIIQRGSQEYLTLPHRLQHRAQIELEARADDNQLVRVGNAGRISTVISDGTRRSRTVITLQATNTGLAGAKFRVVAKDCSPEISRLINDKNMDSTETGRTLIPPHHTKRIKLELPIELPVNAAVCSVSLVNDEDVAVAMRDVTVKRDDRCFCVWYCECVCLGDDHKLLCREMAESRMTAAGLLKRDRPRPSRSVPRECENKTWSLIGVPMGILVFLLLLGFVKASVGLLIAPVGMYGLDKVVQLPIPLQNYQEPWLRSQKMEYDEEGWPVHPDTRKRTVHAITWPVEFGLNIIFFVMLPCLLFREACSDLNKICFCKRKDKSSDTDLDTPSAFSAVQDVQVSSGPRGTRREGEPRRWMTTQAEKLSTELWSRALTPYDNKNDTMRPLLVKGGQRPPMMPSLFVDSEQDDTDYVLTQMQKSRESLVKAHKRKQRQVADTKACSSKLQK